MIRRSLLALVLTALAAVLLAGPATASTAQERQLTSLQTLERAMLLELNALRRQRGLVPLRQSLRLAAAATSHSRSMASRGFFAHTSPDGAPFWRRVQRFYVADGYRYWSAGENLLWSPAGLQAKEAMRMWLASPPHRKNLLSPTWREVGFSAVHADEAPGAFGGLEVVVVTANFGVRR